MMQERKSICVLCGREWIPEIKNRCECGGFCTWGYELNKPESWNIDKNGNWHLNPIPEYLLKEEKRKIRIKKLNKINDGKRSNIY